MKLSVILLHAGLLFSCSSGLRHAEIRVSGNCDMCKETIEGALKAEGIKKASWDPDTKMLELDFDSRKLSLQEIRRKIAAAGYDTDSLKADEKAYSKLHECCHYREN